MRNVGFWVSSPNFSKFVTSFHSLCLTGLGVKLVFCSCYPEVVLHIPVFTRVVAFERVLNCSSWYVSALLYLISFYWTFWNCTFRSGVAAWYVSGKPQRFEYFSEEAFHAFLDLQLLYDAVSGVSRSAVDFELHSVFMAHVKLAQQYGSLLFGCSQVR